MPLPKKAQLKVSSEASDKVEELGEVVSELLSGKTTEAQRFRRYISVRLRQFKLSGTCSVDEVLSDAYIRGYQSITARGLKINNLPSWLRSVALNIIREKGRKVRSLYSMPPNWFDELTDQNNVNLLEKLEKAEVLSAQARQIAKAMEGLSTADKEIIRMRLIDGSSWRDIAQQLGDKTTEAYRQRGSRALARLREAYSSLPDEKRQSHPQNPTRPS